MENEKFLSAIYLIIKNEDGNILFQRRQGTNMWPNCLGLPAGHVDVGENAYEAAIREANEELCIIITKDDILDTFIVNRINKSLPPYYDVYFCLSSYEGIIENKEPFRCSELVWEDINNLSEDVIEYEQNSINNYLKGIKFSVIYTDNQDK